MKRFTYSSFILFVLFVNFRIYAQTISNEVLYQAAKEEFARFEAAHGGFVQTQNTAMHYLSWGNPTDVPLIWSHGSFSNGYELLPMAEALVQSGYYVIAIDYYGHGQTPVPTHEVSLYHVADDIKSLMDELEIDRAVLGGWSRGGYISTAFYDAYPERVLGLILEDGGSVATQKRYHNMDMDSLRQLVDAFEIEKYKAADTTFASEFEAYLSIFDTEVQGNQFDLLAWIKETEEGRWAANPGLFELFHQSSSEQFLETVLQPMRVPLFARSMGLIEPKIIFRHLNVPVLILDPVHEGDLFPFEGENDLLQKNHPDLVEHIIYENTGHNIHAERPEKFIQDVANFLKKVKAYHHL